MEIMMTALNWEALQSARNADRRDDSTDFPPRTGSYRDQMRHGVFASHRRPSPRSTSKSSSSICLSRIYDHQQLHAYADCALHRDFQRKSTIQRDEILGIIRKLLLRCDGWGAACSETEQQIRSAARAALELRLH